MASIRERKIENGVSYTVDIRKKNINITKTFRNKKDAELWATWKEDLIDNMEAFDVKVEHMITLEDAIGLKVKELIDKGSKEINDTHYLTRDFNCFINKYLHEISFDDYNNLCQKMLKKEILVGGKRGVEGSGRKAIQSPATVLRKFVVLAAVYSYLIKQGFDIENHPQKVVSQLRVMCAK